MRSDASRDVVYIRMCLCVCVYKDVCVYIRMCVYIKMCDTS